MNRLIKAIIFVLSIHLSCIILMLIVRGVLIITVQHLMDSDVVSSSLVCESLIRGAWLDNCLLSYADVIPLLYLLVLYYLHRLTGKSLKHIAVYFIIIHVVALGFAIATLRRS